MEVVGFELVPGGEPDPVSAVAALVVRFSNALCFEGGTVGGGADLGIGWVGFADEVAFVGVVMFAVFDVGLQVVSGALLFLFAVLFKDLFHSPAETSRPVLVYSFNDQ